MKKVNLTFLLLFVAMHLMAPPLDQPTICIPEPVKISYFDKIEGYEDLVQAIVSYESGGDTCAFNPNEGAVGAFQIRQCRVDSYNKLLGTNYAHEDFYDYELSKRMFLVYAKGKSFEQAAKDWNGSGPMTITYWENVKKFM
jgi:hypothetical protein